MYAMYVQQQMGLKCMCTYVWLYNNIHGPEPEMDVHTCMAVHNIHVLEPVYVHMCMAAQQQHWT